MKLTQYHFDEIERLQARIKFAEKIIGFFLYVALYSFISWVLIGFFGWFINGAWGFQELRFCNLLLSEGCFFFSSNIYALDLFFNWFFELNIALVICMTSLLLAIPVLSYLNGNLSNIGKIRELDK